MKVLLLDMGVWPSLKATLSSAFGVSVATDGDDLLSLARWYDHDLIVLNFNHQIEQALKLVGRLRTEKVAIPIVVVSSDSRPQKKVEIFDAGADDYVARPFYEPELCARIRAVARRAHGRASSSITVGNTTLNLDEHTVEVNGVKIRLPPKEYRTLELFLIRQDEVIKDDVFMQHVYFNCDDPMQPTLRQFLCRLRKRLRTAGSTVSFETLPRVGYKLSKPKEVRQRLKVAA